MRIPKLSPKGWHVYHVNVSPSKLAATDASEAKFELYPSSIRGRLFNLLSRQKTKLVRKRLLEPMEKPKSLKMQKDASPTKHAENPEKKHVGLRPNVSAGHQELITLVDVADVQFVILSLLLPHGPIRRPLICTASTRCFLDV
ncbi:hypothetical protein K443DRAFT_12746 [Laccaria amethystina LaAM-08-1]|uniref:Uncharacterized protein n=1 Tax=Laccaria amethystina LaAM-08-1 TaxID=1095629 RepID=A0A0C9WIV1_9AGAR|nr:hypothetical protein K443DRAFT_12746 [Laccaria amethystina LaAM-08-1]